MSKPARNPASITGQQKLIQGLGLSHLHVTGIVLDIEDGRYTEATIRVLLQQDQVDHIFGAEKRRWRCRVCNRRYTDAEREDAPQGPNDTGLRYCPDCCRHGMIYEADLAPTDQQEQ